MILEFLIQSILVVSSSAIIIKSLKLKNYSYYYLYFLPFLIFFQGEIQVLFFALLFGVLLSLVIFRPSASLSLLIFLVLTLFFIIYRPQIGVENYPVARQFINQQRGEHLAPLSGFIPRLFHNKLSLFYAISQSFQQYLSPTALFIQAKYKLFISDYLLGYLFPYDAFLLVLALKKSINKKMKNSFNFSAIFLILFYLFAIALFLNPDIKYIFSYAISYFLAIYLIKFISTLSPSIRYSIFAFNFLFIVLHVILSSSFIVQP